MPRPLPGGKSTCVDNTSRSGELKVPTYAINGPPAWADCARSKPATNGVVPANATDVFRNERRDRSSKVMATMGYERDAEYQYSRSVTIPGWGTGYLPSGPACNGAGEPIASWSRPGAISCSLLSMSSYVMTRPV